MNQVIGKAVNRVTGALKVTGGATYSGEQNIDNLVYGVLVESAIAKGKITKIDTSAAEDVSGVLKILTYLNAPKLNEVKMYPAGSAGQTLLPMQDDRIHHFGQDVALVIAETLELATYAASLIEVEYQSEEAISTIEEGQAQAYPASDGELDSTRGNPEAVLSEAEVKVEETYTTPVEHHNPIEPHAVLAQWEKDNLTAHIPMQWVYGAQRSLAKMLDLPKENIRIVSPFVGGAFGCKSFVWSHIVLTVVAARELNRPVKLYLKRSQMYTSNGYRPATIQHFRLAANRDGKLTAIVQEAIGQTSTTDDYVEAPLVSTTQMLYKCPNVKVSYRLAPVNATTPTVMRAPGDTTCAFALESAMDELAYELKLDPIELRLIDYAEVDPRNGKPWSSKELKACYRQGAEHFGWSQRNFEPRSMRDGNYLVGWGMATATYPVFISPAAARVKISADGSVVAQSATHSIGTGVYTAMTQIAAENLGVPVDKVRFELGDTDLPPSPVAGGSRSTASVGAAVQQAAIALREKLIERAATDSDSPLYNQAKLDIAVENGRVFIKDSPDRGETFTEILQRQGEDSIEAYKETEPLNTDSKVKHRVFSGTDGATGPSTPDYTMHSFGAHFAEVKVDPDLGTIKVTRFVGAFAGGRIINQKTANSQVMGAIVGGIGMALLEETVTDPHFGSIINPNLGEYLVPVNADIHNIETFFVPEEDPHIGLLGAKGVGELGIVGAAAAVANAVYHTTGIRVRDLPITLDRVL